MSDSDEYDNNPFAGTTHMFASGITNIQTEDIPNLTSTPNLTSINNLTSTPHLISPNIPNITSPTKPTYLYDESTPPIQETSMSTSHNLSISNTPSLPSTSSSSSSSTSLSSNNTTIQSPSISSNTTTNQTMNSQQLEPFENLSMSMAIPQQRNNNHTTITTTNNNITTTTTTNTIATTNNNTNNHTTTNIHNNNNTPQQIVIIEAGDYNDPWGKHAIGYIIKSISPKDNIIQEVTRRYSEFHSLHHVLTRLLPTIIIPPIPSKHSIIKYVMNPINAQNDSKIISMRQRRLMAFLNHCQSIPEIKLHQIFMKFLDPNYLWKDVLNSPPISILPTNNLLAPPLTPTKPSPLHLLLPSPTIMTMKNMESFCLENLNISKDQLESQWHFQQFNNIESMIIKWSNILQPLLQRIKSNKLHLHSMSSLFAELGAYYNALSLENNNIDSQLPHGIEKIGHSYDVNYVTLEILIENLQNLIEEPLIDLIKFITDSKRIIIFKNLKLTQYQIIMNTITKRKLRLNELNDFDNKVKRLDVALNRDAITSPTVANAVRNMNKQTIVTTTSSLENHNHNNNNIDNDNNQNESLDSPIDINMEDDDDDDNNSNNNEDSQYLIQLQLQKNKQKLKYRKKSTKKNKFGQIEPEFLTKVERDEEIKKLNKELLKLNDCESLIKLDLKQVIESTLNQLINLMAFIKKSCNLMLKDITKAILDWIKECLTTWQQTKLKINNI